MNRPVASIDPLRRTNTFSCDAGGNRRISTRHARTATTTATTNAHGPRVDEINAKFTSTNTIFSHGDAQNSTLALTDASANVLERYRYEAFGFPSVFDSTFSPLSSSLYSVRHLFQGREWLAEAKLNDHRFRYYSPEMQRWMSRDPIAESGGTSLSMFNRNSPLDVTDAYGLKGSGFGSTIGDLCKKLWNFPNTIIGVIGLPFGGSGPNIGNNAIQFPDNPLMVLGDITLGNLILYNEKVGPNKDNPNNFGYTYGDHEHQYTFQGETLGPLYLPANLIWGVISLFTTGN